MKKILTVILATTMIASTALIGGCGASQGGENSNGSASDKSNTADYGKLGFITEINDINRGASTYSSCAYVMRNTENEVYVLTAFAGRPHATTYGGSDEHEAYGSTSTMIK